MEDCADEAALAMQELIPPTEGVYTLPTVPIVRRIYLTSFSKIGSESPWTTGCIGSWDASAIVPSSACLHVRMLTRFRSHRVLRL